MFSLLLSNSGITFGWFPRATMVTLAEKGGGTAESDHSHLSKRKYEVTSRMGIATIVAVHFLAAVL